MINKRLRRVDDLYSRNPLFIRSSILSNSDDVYMENDIGSRNPLFIRSSILSEELEAALDPKLVRSQSLIHQVFDSQSQYTARNEADLI